MPVFSQLILSQSGVACQRLPLCERLHHSRWLANQSQQALPATGRVCALQRSRLLPECRRSASCGASLLPRAGSSAGPARRPVGAPGCTAAAASRSTDWREGKGFTGFLVAPQRKERGMRRLPLSPMLPGQHRGR